MYLFFNHRMPQQAIGSIINCGYARVAIRRQTSHAEINKVARRRQFQAQFKSVTDYCSDIPYFNPQSKGCETHFDRGCTQIVKAFNRKWNPNEARCEYMATFSVETWKQLPAHKKRTHTMSNCQGCLLAHANLQAKFPGAFTNPSMVLQASQTLIASTAAPNKDVAQQTSPQHY